MSSWYQSISRAICAIALPLYIVLIFQCPMVRIVLGLAKDLVGAIPLRTSELISDVFTPELSPRKSNKADEDISEINIYVAMETSCGKESDIFGDLRRKPLRHCENDAAISETRLKASHEERVLLKNDAEENDVVCDTVEITEGEKPERQKTPSCSTVVTALTAVPAHAIYGDLKSRLAGSDRQVDYIQGDGNCFFRALSKEVYGSEDFHQEWRQAVCDLVLAHPHVFRQYVDHGNVDKHVECMRALGTWATSCEIYAASTLLRREVYVLTPRPYGVGQYHWLFFSPRTLTGSSSSGGSGASSRRKSSPDKVHPCYLTLCHTNGNHYDRITPVMARCNCQIPAPNLDGVSVLVDLTESSESSSSSDGDETIKKS